MTDTIRTLSHNDLVRLAGWGAMTYAKVGALKGYFAGRGVNMTEEFERAARLGHDIAWTVYPGAALVGGPERHAYYDRERAKAASATTLVAGELVEIEGRRYTVVVVPGNENGPRNSDPIKFRPFNGEGR